MPWEIYSLAGLKRVDRVTDISEVQYCLERTFGDKVYIASFRHVSIVLFGVKCSFGGRHRRYVFSVAATLNSLFTYICTSISKCLENDNQ